VALATVSALTYRYPGAHEALRECSLEIEPGEVVDDTEIIEDFGGDTPAGPTLEPPTPPGAARAAINVDV